MRYVVTYLSAGEAATAQVEARDAAAAVEAVQEDCASHGAFELLSVVPAVASEPSATTRSER
jgi:hypothetical protein